MTASRGVCLVTGASRGIGAACARLLARDGWDIVVNYAADEAAAEAVCASIRSDGRQAWAVRADVGDPAAVVRLFEAVDGVGRLGALVNNAGIVAPTARLDAIDDARIARMIAVNLTGSILCAREAVRRLSSAHGGPGGAIVNLSSAAAVHGSPGQYVDYAATKGAIDSFTIGLAREVGREGIRVNAVRPGIIDTDIHASGGEPDRVARMRESLPMGREGSADEVAEAVAWLISDAASYVTGAILNVSGGR